MGYTIAVELSYNVLCTHTGSISCCRTRDLRLLPRYSQKAADLLPMGQGGFVWYAASHNTQVLYVKTTWAKHGTLVQAPWQTEAKKLCIRRQV